MFYDTFRSISKISNLTTQTQDQSPIPLEKLRPSPLIPQKNFYILDTPLFGAIYKPRCHIFG